MAQKKAEEVVDNPLTSSEEEESGSSKSEYSVEFSKKDEFSKKPESDSEGEYELEFESDSEPAKMMELTPIVTKPIPDKSRSAKRPLKEVASEATKTSETEHVKKPTTNDEVKKISRDDAKKMFQRLFSEADEIALLQDIEQKGFELSRKIWGNNCVLASKSSRKKLGGTPAPKEMKSVAHSSPKKQQEETKKPEKSETKVVNTSLSIGREIASFFDAGNASSCGLAESTITAVWAKVADGAEKREVEEKWKKLKGKEFELCLQRSGLVNETAKMIFKAYES
ncbi:hypothetical protein ISN44_As10g009970 [Arabidopsis suecica]|uniref:Glabrous enhancer-binding protein-like C-terminal domain-containing protein n=1 Tax=Arabidopsis suecica TaxID=45249 RepID=A0A8T1ZXC2_ARASU|nr:hypothetical protein ISN44_As10g009970 [Arabidopsis suecica]